LTSVAGGVSLGLSSCGCARRACTMDRPSHVAHRLRGAPPRSRARALQLGDLTGWVTRAEQSHYFRPMPRRPMCPASQDHEGMMHPTPFLRGVRRTRARLVVLALIVLGACAHNQSAEMDMEDEPEREPIHVHIRNENFADV